MKIRRIDFSPDEWIAGTIGLDNAERGLYITACALIYSAGGPIPIDHLRTNCRDHGNAFKRQLDRLVSLGKLIINGGQIANKRAINELQKARKRSTNGRQNVAKRWKNNSLGDKVVLRPSNTHARAINHQPSTTTSSLRSEGIETTNVVSPSSQALRTRQLNDEFAEVWPTYPRHIGKGAALKAYRKARQSANAETLREAIERLALARAGEDPQFTPHMSTWLNQQRWLDDEGGSDAAIRRREYAGPTGPPPTYEEVQRQRAQVDRLG